MKYIKFEVKNFKGIRELTMDLSKKPSGNIFPLVGLNESGKTTILEAIDYFQKDMRDDEKHQLIHKRDKGGFSGEIEVTATLEFDQGNREIINGFIENLGYQLKSEVKAISITKQDSFKDSVFLENNFLCSFVLNDESFGLQVKTAEQKIYRDLCKDNNEEWSNLVNAIKDKLLPKILYFPDFIFKFPKKIYLTEPVNTSYSGDNKNIQDEYRLIIEDVLKSVNSDYSLNKLSDKLKSQEEQGRASAKQILNEIENKFNEKILSQWDNIFPDTPNKTISIKDDIDNESTYLEFSINEGNATFLVDERSLGFRWFFGFILFTEFRQIREGDKETLFLFDEPANNLHQASQQKLLNLFNNISEKSKILYSTHSHYLLNAKLILNTFIVNDCGRANSDNYDYRQDIKATPYREFCSNKQNDITHFQPILDVLEYIDNPFEQVNNIVFFEGKNDYYTFKWIFNTCLKLNADINFYPGGGVQKYENIFREYLAHNRNFIAIFDSDVAGGTHKNNYIDKISEELKDNIFSLEDIDENFTNITTEFLFTGFERIEIQKISYKDSTSYKKDRFNHAIQELFIANQEFDISNDTKEKFNKIFKFINKRLSRS